METNDIPPPRAEIRLQELGLAYDCTEVGNMERLVARCRGQFLYIPEKRSWAHWKGDRWSICGNATIFQAGLQTARTLFDEARDCQTEEGRRRLGQWAISSQSDRRITSMIRMASKNPSMVGHLDGFDTNPFHLNCANGIVDLKTGAVRPHYVKATLMHYVAG